MTAQFLNAILTPSPHDPGKGQQKGDTGRSIVVVIPCLERPGMFSDILAITWRGTLTVGLLLVALQASGLLH